MSVDKLSQAASQPLRGRMFRQGTSLPNQKRILVLKTGIAGIMHYIENEEEMDSLKSIVPGSELLLFREPENEYDKWAIAVYLTREDKLGFISRFKNETIARLMDVGKQFIGVVDDPETDADAKMIVEKELRRNRRAPTENMALPFSIYLLEDQ